MADNSSLTKATMVVISRLGDFWVSPERAEKIMQLKVHNPNDSIELDGSLIGLNTVDGVITAAQYDDYNKKKNGYWKCKYGWWHERYQQCAHTSYNRS